MTPRGTILIADDDLGIREVLQVILQPLYDVHTTANGEEALRIIQSQKIDVVTLDLKMLGLSGIQVLQEIKKIKEDIEVIIITGYGTLPNAQEAIRYGAVDFISKPFKIADIRAVVDKAFERRNYNLKIKALMQKIEDIRASRKREDGKV